MRMKNTTPRKPLAESYLLKFKKVGDLFTRMQKIGHFFKLFFTGFISP